MADADSSMASQASLDGALKLLSGSTNEEQIVGASLILQWAAASQPVDPQLSARILDALQVNFICRMLATANPQQCRGIAVALIRLLAVDRQTATRLSYCLGSMLRLLASLAADGAPGNGAETNVEPSDVVEACRQLLRLATTEVVLAELPSFLPALEETAKSVAEADDVALLDPTLAVLQELLSIGSHVPAAAADDVLRNLALNKASRNTAQRRLAISLLCDRLEAGVEVRGLAAVLEELLAGAPTIATAGTGTPWEDRVAVMRFTAMALPQVGLALLHADVSRALRRLQKLLVLASGEVRTALEGKVPQESLCAACMLLEAAVSLLGEAAVRADIDLEAAAECLRVVHRTLVDVFDYCKGLSEDAASPEDVDPDAVLPVLARFVAVWQLEDPVRFAHEFSLSLRAFCRLPPAEFEVLIPALHELQDWHMTPALIKVLQVVEWAVSQAGTTSAKALCPSALLLTELALDAAAYLPEAITCGPPVHLPRGGEEAPAEKLPLMLVDNWSLSRPAIAADWQHEGVGYLCSWSRYLWDLQARMSPNLELAERFALATLCGSLLVSVPEEAVNAQAANGFPETLWSTVATCLLSRFKDDAAPACGTDKDEDAASTWRLTLRLCGFALDRHSRLRWGLSCCVADRSEALDLEVASWQKALEIGAGESGEEMGIDEWREVDDEAVVRVTKFLRAMSKYCFILGHKSEPAGQTAAALASECQLSTLD